MTDHRQVTTIDPSRLDPDAPEYRSRWNTEAHSRFEAVRAETVWVADTGTFTDSADVPEWIRRTTAGHLMPSNFPSLSLAMVWAPIDWPMLIDEHPNEVRLWGEETNSTYIPWTVICAAYRLLVDAGLSPGLHMLLEVDFDGALALEPGSLWCESIENHPDLIARVDAVFAPYVDFQHGMWHWG